MTREQAHLRCAANATRIHRLASTLSTAYPVSLQIPPPPNPPKASDVPDIRSLHSLVLPVQYPPAFFTQLLVLSSRACLIAARRSQPNRPIAFISAALHKPSSLQGIFPNFSASKVLLNSPRPRIELLTLGVLPAFQHSGIARRLIHAVVDKLSAPLNAGILVHANVATTNAAAIKFYESIGLRVASDVIPNLYRTCPHGQRDAYLVAGRIDHL